MLTFHLQPSPFEVIQQADGNPPHLLMPRNRFALHKLYWRTTAVVDSKSFKWRGFETTALLQYSKLFKLQGFQNNSSTAVFKVIQVAGVRNNSAAAVFKVIQVAGVRNNSAIAEFKVTQASAVPKQLPCCSFQSDSSAGVPQQLRYCNIPSHWIGRVSKIIPPRQNSKTKLFLVFMGSQPRENIWKYRRWNNKQRGA